MGRLDKDSHGLILMTNQGDIVNKMMRSGNRHEKEYVVKVSRPITDKFLETMRQGMYLEEIEKQTRPCVVKKINAYTFRIILTQGLNRQIRRMCETCGYHVTDLVRVRILNLRLEDIPEGSFREITREEYRILLQIIKDSSNTTVIEQGKQDE